MTTPQTPGQWSDPSQQQGWPDPAQQQGWQPPTQPRPSAPPAQSGYPAYEAAPPNPYGAAPGYGQPPAPGYGQPPMPGYGQPPVQYVMARPTNGLAIAALICALVGLAPVGAILGHVARKQIKQTGEQGDGMALAGIIVGWILTGVGIIVCGLYIALIGWAINESNNYDPYDP